MSEPTTVALVHPGEMGAGVGGVLARGGQTVLFASRGRSPESLERARRAGLVDVEELARLAEAPIVISICPPHAAIDVARAFASYRGIYVDANAISPGTAETIRTVIEGGGGTFVDGSIIGPPPGGSGHTTLYLSGAASAMVAPVLTVEGLTVTDLGTGPTAASALKMAFGAWTKGSNALLLVTRALAHALGVEDALVAAWDTSRDGGSGQRATEATARWAAKAASDKGWRWIGEMEEVAATFREAGLPDGFAVAAAEIFARAPRNPADDDSLVATVVGALLAGPTSHNHRGSNDP
jgi:3-hydroxyisobutyrate dehydrogenase-like beta-hydroxyacid dehydrogenase